MSLSASASFSTQCVSQFQMHYRQLWGFIYCSHKGLWSMVAIVDLWIREENKRNTYSVKLNDFFLIKWWRHVIQIFNNNLYSFATHVDIFFSDENVVSLILKSLSVFWLMGPRYSLPSFKLMRVGKSLAPFGVRSWHSHRIFWMWSSGLGIKGTVSCFN